MYEPVRRNHISSSRKKKARFLTVFLTIAVLLLLRQLSEGIDPVTVSGAHSSKLTADLPTHQYITVSPTAPAPPVYAKNILLLDAENGDVLYGQKIDDPIPVASTTKMVTALTVVRKMKLDTITTVSKRPPTVQGSKINLRAGEKISVGDLLKGLLINSGNDAAFALAEAYSGKEGEYQPFIDEMNAYVREHNLPTSKFFDPAGLDDERGRSTARELAHIARLVLADSTLRSIIMTPQTAIASTDGAIVHELKNTNRLIQSDTIYYLPNALGVKTGFTHEAGHCLVAAYTMGDKTLIGVVMNTAEYTTTASASEMRKLFLWAEKHTSLRQYRY